MIWKPDTCKCVVEYNGSNEPANFVRVVSKCSEHQNIPDSNLAQVLLSENQMKNHFQGQVFRNIPTAFRALNIGEKLLLEIQMRLNRDFSPVPSEIQMKEYRWSFDAQRNLIVDLSDFGPAEKTFAQTEANKLFPNKIKII